MTPIRVLLANDHTLVRAVVWGCFFRVSRSWARRATARRPLAQALQPDVVLMDVL
jgi:hypothetical protein